MSLAQDGIIVDYRLFRTIRRKSLTVYSLWILFWFYDKCLGSSMSPQGILSVSLPGKEAEVVLVAVSSPKPPFWYGLILLLWWLHFGKSPLMDLDLDRSGNNQRNWLLFELPTLLTFLTSHYSLATSSIGTVGVRRKRRARKRERSTVESAIEITQKWFLLPHKWNKKKVFEYRTGEYSTWFYLGSHPKFYHVNLLNQRAATITNTTVDHWT